MLSGGPERTGIHLSLLPRHDYISSLFKMWVLGTQTWILMLARQALGQLRYHRSPERSEHLY